MATVRVHTSDWTDAVQLAAFNSLQVVAHLTVAATERPANAGSVLWFGSATPTNSQPGDFWSDGNGIKYHDPDAGYIYIAPPVSGVETFDPRKLAQYSRVSPTNAGGGQAEVVGAKWDTLSDTTCLNASAGFPQSWGLAANNAVKGTNTNVALFQRGTGLFGDGWRLSFMFFVNDTLSTWSTPGVGEGTRLFIGLSNQNPSTVVGSDNPTGHRAGLSFVNVNGARQDTNLTISTKDGTTETLTTSSIELAKDKVYEVNLTQIPDGDIEWEIRNLTDDPLREDVGATANHDYGTITNNLPTALLKAVVALNAVGAVNKDVWLPHFTVTA